MEKQVVSEFVALPTLPNGIEAQGVSYPPLRNQVLSRSAPLFSQPPFLASSPTGMTFPLDLTLKTDPYGKSRFKVQKPTFFFPTVR